MSLRNRRKYVHVKYLWEDIVANKLSDLEKLVYRSNCLGSDLTITNTGGGNTSSKLLGIDPLTDEQVDILWVKGSGGDLRTVDISGFSSLYLNKFKQLEEIYSRTEVKGPKTPVEDYLVGLYSQTTFNLNPRATSIDTPFHALIPYKHVDHMHPISAITIAACKNGPQVTERIYGKRVLWTDWQRPGFDLSTIMKKACDKDLNLQGIIMGKHGIVNWANDSKECYELTLELIDIAAKYIKKHDKGVAAFGGVKHKDLSKSRKVEVINEILPSVRGLVSENKSFIATVETNKTVIDFVNSHKGKYLSEMGTSCPDHFIRTKVKPLFVDWNPHVESVEILKENISKEIKQYRRYYKKYYDKNKEVDSPQMRDPNPTVVLIPGVGMFSFGKNKSESRVTAEFYNGAVEVIKGCESIDEYSSLPQKEAFDIEYWSLEDAKLKRLPPEKSLAGKIIVVVGAGSGIGRSSALLAAKNDAHVLCADIDVEAAKATSEEINQIYGEGIGVGGSGISSCNKSTYCKVDVEDVKSIKEMFNTAVYAYGGIDDVIITAGYYPTINQQSDNSTSWAKTFGVNVEGSYNIAFCAKEIWDLQNTNGSLVLFSSANAVVAKNGTLAYDTSKTAVSHLIRELAIELAPKIRVNGVAPATVVNNSSMFPRDRVISSLKKYSIKFKNSDSTLVLRDKLARFYSSRTLLKQPIEPEYPANVAIELLTDRFKVTTGHIISVDGGLPDAFLR